MDSLNADYLVMNVRRCSRQKTEGITKSTADSRIYHEAMHNGKPSAMP